MLNQVWVCADFTPGFPCVIREEFLTMERQMFKGEGGEERGDVFILK